MHLYLAFMNREMQKDWGIYRLKDADDLDVSIHPLAYSILYTATDHLNIIIKDKSISIDPETFYFLPPKSSFSVIEKYKKAVLIWFKPEVFMDRLKFLYYITNCFFFQNPLGVAAKNSFIPYKFIVKNYARPLQTLGANPLIKRNLLANFIEFILIRAQLDFDPGFERGSKNVYDQEIANKFSKLLDEQVTFNLVVSYYADKLNITKRRLDKATQIIYGCSAKSLVTGRALDKAKAMLRSTSIPVKNISLELGFSQESNFNNFFKLHIGMTPMQYRINANAIIFGENTALS